MDDEGGVEEFCSYFAKMITTTKPTQEHTETALVGLHPKVSDEMNEELEQPFTEDEISAALCPKVPYKIP